ncbi:MAG: SpoIIE family protein phosphatase [Erysipelotrichaceae bacterium]|nr:SpoIIE family protein phosphatase [Erysipelotrichaceae bacterium]
MTNTENTKKIRNKPKGSLAARVFWLTQFGSFVLGTVLLCVFMIMYGYVLSRQYIAESFNNTKICRTILQYTADPEPLVHEVVEVYKNLSEDNNDPESKEYLSHFSYFRTREDYLNVLSTLDAQIANNNIENMYIGVYDRQKNVLLYVMDADNSSHNPYPTGFYETVPKSEIDKFFDWNGSGYLYDISNMEKYGWICSTGIPVYFQDERFAGFILSDISLRDIFHGVMKIALRFIIALIIAAFIIGYIIARLMQKAVVDPVNKISDAAIAYVNDRRSGIKSGNHFENIAVTADDELSNLSHVMAEMETGLNEYQDNLTTITAERERMAAELGLAARIQSDALPKKWPAFEDRDEFDIFAMMDPAREIGGDFYDFFLVDDDHLAVMIADVSGKGIPASLFMMASKIVLDDYARSGSSPSEILENANRIITRDNNEKMFVTAWVGILELSTGILKAANAGHEYPVITNDEGNYELYKDRHGFVLGALDELKYKEYEIRMKPGMKLFVYTDGVPEAEAEDGEMFGTERLVNALNQHPHADCEKTLKHVLTSVGEFVKDYEQSDDLTMLCLEYKGKRMNEVFEKEFDAELSKIEEATDYINEILEQMDCPLKAQTAIDIAIDELFCNIAKYGYKEKGGKIVLRAEKPDDSSIRITFIDSGIEFNPLKVGEPDLISSADDREVGGLGIFLVRKTMDEVTYRYEDGKNMLSILKKF